VHEGDNSRVDENVVSSLSLSLTLSAFSCVGRLRGWFTSWTLSQSTSAMDGVRTLLFFGNQVNLVRYEDSSEVQVGVCTDVFEPFFCLRKDACEVAS